MNQKPLFIPLTGKWFDQFASGVKSTEYRRYGPRWNERTCSPGRRVVLSRGYGKRRRLTGSITGFEIGPHVEIPQFVKCSPKAV